MSIDNALELLASRSPVIEAVGVTDYACTSSFRAAVDAQARGIAPHIFLFPNVELRLSHATMRDSAINLHLLTAPSEIDELERFLSGFEFVHADRPYRCDATGLRDLGRAYTGDASLPEAAARSEGANQFKIDFDKLRTEFGRDAWAKENLLVAVATGSGDGTSGLRTEDHAFNALRESIERFAHIMLTGNPANVAFWLGQGVDDEATLIRKYRGKKVCLHGSDAHDADRLGVPALDRFCWIKGALSFDTLRLACLSPETRAHLGAASPTDGYGQGRISHIQVDGASWFPAEGVPINPGLVAIIGARGSGKTALADLIAAGAGSEAPFSNPLSFVSRADILLTGAASRVNWSHGETTEAPLRSGFESPSSTIRTVRYLSQQFVEQLCAEDGVSAGLLAEIERVVFESYPTSDRLGATNFDDLLAIRLQGSRGRQADELTAISATGDRITEERTLNRSLDRRRNDLAKTRAGLADLEKKAADLLAQGTEGSAARLASVSGALASRSSDLQAADRRAKELVALRDRVDSTRSTVFPQLWDTLHREYPNVGLSDNEWEAFRPGFSGDVDVVLTKSVEAANATSSALRGSAPSLPSPSLDHLDDHALRTQTVAVLKAEVDRLQQLVGLDQRRTADLAKYNAQAADLRAAIAKQEQELAHAEGAATRIAVLASDRRSHYAAYFDALLTEEVELRRLYEPLAAVLAEFGGTAAKLQLAVRRRVDLTSWVRAGEDLLDLRTEGPFRGAGSLARLAEQKLLPAWQTGDGDSAAQAIGDFSASHSEDLRRQGRARDGSTEEVRHWESRINDWLYGADHITLGYTLMYDKLSIERLSPGLRGIVLLLLYLAVDRTESDPLIIDQPEENLDPESVYTELVRLFREASRRRQIIMVTHNANLVVNTDVDQVLIAHGEGYEEGRLPTLSYASGGLEDPEIRQQVCEVLEGGAEAFRQRALRLGVAL